MKNGIVINGIEYETVFVDIREHVNSTCPECGLRDYKPLTGCGHPCVAFSDEYNYISAYFRRIKDQDNGKEK